MACRSLIRRATLVVVMVGALAPAARAQALDPIYPPKPTGWAAPALHTTLSTSFAILQTLDVATTLRGVSNGRAREANPLMGGLAQRPAALVGVKAGLTAATIFSMHSLSKTHPKAAVLTMLALNAGSAFVVRSNFRLAVSR